MDLQRLDDCRKTVEQACLQLGDHSCRQQAEAVLMELRQSPHAIPACQHILEHSSNAAAQFQASVAIREAALRQWALLGPQGSSALRAYILEYIIRHAGSLQRVVALQLARVLAVLLKRAWASDGAEAHHPFFSELQHKADGAGNAAARRLNVEILEAIVSEFSPATASPMGLPWEAHERCRASLEAHMLQDLFVRAVRMAQSATSLALQGQDDGVCAACISLISAILTWEFRHANAPLPNYGVGRPAGDGTHVRPGSAWRDLLLNPEAFAWLLQQLLPALSGQPGMGQSLAAPARQLLVLLCLVCGDVFPKQAHGRTGTQDARSAYLSRLMAVILRWMSPAQEALARAASSDEAELLDACRAISAAAPVHRAAGFDRSSCDASSHCLLQIAELTCACIAHGGLAEANEGTWVADAAELLLDAWVELLADDSFSPRARPSTTAQQAAAGVFQAAVHAYLADAAAGAEDDEAEGEAAETGAGASAAREAAFARAAALGRAAADSACALLLSLLHDRRAQLQRCVSSGEGTSTVLEELTWLARMTAHLIADPGEGETPLPPLTIAAAASQACQSGQQDPLAALSWSLLDLASLCADPASASMASPRLAEAAVWAAARWADTYLMPDAAEPPSPAMHQAFSAGSPPADQTLASLVRVATAALASPVWAGEVDLHRVAVVRLLPALLRRLQCTMRLVALPEWQQITTAFAQQAGGIQALAHPILRGLAQVLTSAASGIPSREQTEAYVTYTFAGILGELQQSAAQQATQAGLSTRVLALLECLRGSARGTVSRTEAATWALTHACLPALETMSLAAARSRQSEGSALLFKLAAELVEAHIAYLQPAEAGRLCAWVHRLVGSYAQAARGSVSVAPAAALRAEAAADTARELRALLKLLSNLTQRELVDFSTEEEQQPSEHAPPDIAQVVFEGLGVLVPLMSGELLLFPKLCRSYFALLSHMVEVYPERLASLPGPEMCQLLGTLEWGVCSDDAEVAQASLEALAVLASSQYDAASKGGQGYPALQGKGGQLLARFMWTVLQRLLASNTDRDVTDSAADALLPLMLAFPAAFQNLGEDLLTGQTAAATCSTLAKWLSSLAPVAGVTRVDRTTKRQFRTLLTSFLADARGLLRVQ